MMMMMMMSVQARITLWFPNIDKNNNNNRKKIVDYSLLQKCISEYDVVGL